MNLRFTYFTTLQPSFQKLKAEKLKCLYNKANSTKITQKSKFVQQNKQHKKQIASLQFHLSLIGTN
jgi:hypothetical protein